MSAKWTKPFLGPFKGNASIGIGAQFWKDYFRFRNLVGRVTLDLAPGVRAHFIGRRREGNWQHTPFRPDIDEAYLEALTFGEMPNWNLAANLRVGRVRYLRFPFPDQTAVFDTVTGISDLTGGPVTDYRGAVFSSEAAHRSGLGIHFTGIAWGFNSDQHGLQPLDGYLFYRPRLLDGWSFEGRAGGLQMRTEPLGRPARAGISGFVGKQVGEFELGVLAERRRGEPIYTGVMVRFRPTAITRALGAVGFDYARNPQGIGMQADIAHWNIGMSSKPGPNEELVGEIVAERMRTYWRQSFQRNEYEHRISSWGEYGKPDLRVVAVEEPWRLDLEALVSPHTSIDNHWLRDRQGPAQLGQKVVYQFYRKKSTASSGAR
jgi:hypothetical protein